MDSIHSSHGAFDALDLEVIERVYEAALTQISAFDPLSDAKHDAEREACLRKQVFALARKRPVDYDTLLHDVLRGFVDVSTVVPFQMAKKRKKDHPR